MVGVTTCAADTDADAQRLFTSQQLQFVNLRRGTPGPLPPPVDSMEGRWSALERAGVDRAFAYAAVGAPETVRRRLRAILDETQADELILTAQIFDHRARLRSFEIAAAVCTDIEGTARA